MDNDGDSAISIAKTPSLVTMLKGEYCKVHVFCIILYSTVQY